MIVDKNSANGTKMDGKLVEPGIPTPLFNNSTLMFGDCKIEYRVVMGDKRQGARKDVIGMLATYDDTEEDASSDRGKKEREAHLEALERQEREREEHWRHRDDRDRRDRGSDRGFDDGRRQDRYDKDDREDKRHDKDDRGSRHNDRGRERESDRGRRDRDRDRRSRSRSRSRSHERNSRVRRV
jgi:hypothetical protein